MAGKKTETKTKTKTKAKMEKSKAMPFDDFVMMLLNAEAVSEMAAYHLTRSCKTAKEREVFYQVFAIGEYGKAREYWEALTPEARKRINARKAEESSGT